MTERPTVVCISSLQFTTDIQVLQTLARGINWHILPDFDVAKAQAGWMPKYMQQQTDYAYATGPHIAKVWELARAVGLKFMKDIMKEHRVSAVMAGNWDYWNDEAIRLACETLGIPFLTLLREHFLTREDNEDGFGYQGYKLKPKTQGVAVAGDVTLRTLSKFNIIPEERIRVTGLPRFDLWYAPRPPMFERPVVLLSYRKGYGAEEQFQEMLHLFAELAERHPTIPFVVKPKHQPEYEVMKELVADISDKVQVVLTWDMPRLLQGARAIIGYNSLSLYEGLMTDAPIFLPQWGQTKRDPRTQAPDPADRRLNGHMKFFETEEEFKAALDDAIAGRYPVSDRKARRALFAEYVCFSENEPASLRVQKFVQEFGNP